MVDHRAVDPKFAITVRLSSMRFLSYTAEEIKSISCKAITNPVTFDQLLHPNNGGLYDPAMGPTNKMEPCKTCGLNDIHCPGHMGHIAIPLPVFHPIFFQPLYQVLRSSCFVCHRFLATPYQSMILKGQMQLLRNGLLTEALELEYSTASGEDGEKNSEVIEAISEYVKSCLKEKEFSRVHHHTKHLTHMKRVVVSNFIKDTSSCSRCPHCSAPHRKVREEHQTKVFLKSLSSKQATSWTAAKRKEEAFQEITKMDDTTNILSDTNAENATKNKVLTPLEARAHLRSMWANDPALLTAVFSSLGDETRFNSQFPSDLFFLEVIPVPPSRFRPISVLGSKRFENNQTANLQRILVECQGIQELMNERKMSVKEEDEENRPITGKSKKSFPERLQDLWYRLQSSVNQFMDSDIGKSLSKESHSGIRQILEKKEGLFRKHMMGKRVNYAARSVISPDPFINVDEIGVPMVFASKLTYPQPVTHWNIHELRQAVINGPAVYPGASHVQNEDGVILVLNASQPQQRRGVANKLLSPSRMGLSKGSCKKVYRHLKNGDVLLMNRQPTLHKPSIMAHKARVLPGEKTFRLHYANCKSFNADFDGDEMNAHFPQNELARSEAYNIVSTHHQYLVPKDGTPLSGLIQDHVVAGVLMTIRGRLFSWEDYQVLLFSSLSYYSKHFKLLPPCVVKPQRLWSGKQVISTLLLNLIPANQKRLNLVSKSKISAKEWGRHCKPKHHTSLYSDEEMTESEVVFRDGQLLSGVLDKSQFGASQFGFVHACFELYGGATADQLLSALGRLFTTFLRLHGFTLGVEDILVTSKADKERRKCIKMGRGCGHEAAVEAFGLSDSATASQIKVKYAEAHLKTGDDTGMKVLDYCFKKRTDACNNAINTACVPAGLCKPFPWNCLQLMTQSGAKGSTVNCMQISCLLGQIELEGRRPPIMPSGKSLPSFLPYDCSPRAGGFIDGRFLTGIRPQEYFFHCMAGREGLVDTAVKTSRSGYLQRCIIKHLEGVCVNYDLTVRDSDGSLIQFLYGEDGLDIGKTRYLSPNQFNFLSENFKALRDQLSPQFALQYIEEGQAAKHQQRVNRWQRRHKRRLDGSGSSPRRSGFLYFCEKHLPEVQLKMTTPNKAYPEFNSRTKAELKLIKLWNTSAPMVHKSFNKKTRRCPDPVNSLLRPDRHFGALPEKLSENLSKFISTDLSQSKQDPSQTTKLKTLIQFKTLRAMAEPGEAVGLLAAQSIGEPSTQMTLNTFHFAGRGEMNVTLGIPRLREILMTASPFIKTPAMDVPILPLPDAKAKGEYLKKVFTRVRVADVLEKVELWESMGREGRGFSKRVYKIKMTFLEHSCYADEYLVTPGQVLEFIENKFIIKLASAINRKIRQVQADSLKSVGMITDEEKAVANDDPEDDNVPERPPSEDDDTEVSDMDDGDTNATSSKQMKKKIQHVSYDGPDEDEEEELTSPMESDSDEEGGAFVSKSGHETERLSNYLKQKAKERISHVINSNSHVTNYKYDSTNQHWCKITMQFPNVDCKIMLTSVIERLAYKCVVREVENITRGLLSEDTGQDGRLRLKTEGVNLQELWKYEDILDLRQAYSNNIHSMADTYGVEAACKAIIKEISGVFQVYGIHVDYHHLSLIADYMTFTGQYRPFNRLAMEANSSPFQKMSFETTMHFLRNATISGDLDNLSSPSACIVTGRVVQGGTGCFELHQKLI